MTAPIVMWRLMWGGIKPVQCAKFTASYVWPVERNGRRTLRLSEWSSYYETWADAHAALMAQAESKLANCRRELERLKGDHGRIKGMKPPADVEGEP
jgi:hypothetical protein